MVDKTEKVMRERLTAEQQDLIRLGHKNPFYQYVLDHGRDFILEPLTVDETMKLAFSKKRVKPKRKVCFSNALRLWLDNNDFKYCEGYISAFPDMILVPIYHAWNCIHGKLVDVTLVGYQYFGVEFKDEDVDKHIKMIMKDKEWRPIIDDWWHDWPFLREKGYL